MPCACQKVVRGHEPGTLNAYIVHVEGGCAVVFDDRCVVFATPEDAAAAAVEQGFADWDLVAVTV